MYTAKGVQITVRKTIPWDETRQVKLRSGETVTRNTLLVQEDQVPFVAPGLGVIRRSDVGRLLVVDRYADGRHVDYLVSPRLAKAASSS